MKLFPLGTNFTHKYHANIVCKLHQIRPETKPDRCGISVYAVDETTGTKSFLGQQFISHENLVKNWNEWFRFNVGDTALVNVKVVDRDMVNGRPVYTVELQ